MGSIGPLEVAIGLLVVGAIVVPLTIMALLLWKLLQREKDG